MALLRELSIGGIVSRIAAVLIFAALLGALLALFARLMGDKRPQYDGRLTLNPFAQLSVWGVAIGALFTLSWIRPLRYDPANNRLGPWGVTLVVLAGLAATLTLVPLADLLRPLALLLPRSGSYAALMVLNQFQAVAAGSTLLNLLPIPGLAAGALIQAFRPDIEKRLQRLEPIGLGLVIVAIVAGLLPSLGPAVLPFVRFI